MEIFRYNPSAKYSPNNGVALQRLRGEDLTHQNIMVDQNGSSFRAQFKDIFTDYKITSSATAELLDKWNKHTFLLWQTQLDFATWCATSGCGISIEHLMHSNPMIRSIYRFHVYFQIRKILNELEVALPDEQRFKKLNNPFSMEAFRSITSQYGLSSDETVWKSQYFFSSYQSQRKHYGAPGLAYFDENSWSRWIIETSDGLTRIGIEKLSQSVRYYAYLILESQASARSDIIGNDSKAIDAQQLFISGFEAAVMRKSNTGNEISQFENVLRYARSKVDFVVAFQVYLLPSDLRLRIGNVQGWNNKVLVAKETFQIGQNTTVNAKEPTTRDPKSRSKPNPAAHPLPKHHRVASAAHEDAKTAIVVLGVGAILLAWWYF